MPDENDQLILYVVLPIGVGVLLMGILQLVADLRRRENKRVSERLSGYANTGPPAHLIRDMISSQRSAIARFLSSEGLGAHIRQFVHQADVPWPAHRVISFVALVACVTLILGLAAHQYLGGVSWTTVAVLPLVAGGLPVLALTIRRSWRLNKCNEQLPDLFEMLGQTLRAGHSLIAGLQLAGEQLPPPLGREVARAFQEQSFGAKLEDSLAHFADRIGLLDVRMFVTAVLVQRQTGGDLAEVLDKSGAVVRGRIELHRQVKALTAEGRMSGWVLTLLPIFIALVIYRMNPNYMSELFFGDARFLLKYGVLMNIVGFLAIQKLVKIKY